MTNRALVLCSLADGPSLVRGALAARDTQLMVEALRALGVGIDPVDDDAPTWSVRPAPMHGDVSVHCGLAGTVMRFVPPVAALARGPVRFDGDAAARRRPMAPLLHALRACGVQVTDGASGLPFTVGGTGSVSGGSVSVDASKSSQFVSGLLLAAARYDQGLTLRNTGRVVPNRPHIDMTLRMLGEHRVTAVSDPDAGNETWRVDPSGVAARDWSIEPDLSNATPFIAAALLTQGTVRFEGLGRHSVQAIDPVAALVESLGGVVELTDEALTVRGRGVVSGGELDLRDLGELTPTVTALALLADTPTRIRGVDYLRGHETDRLTALATEATRCGGDVTITDDGLLIRPAPLTGGRWHTYHDHRMATAGAILGLRVPGMTIENVSTTGKTLPGFVELWHRLVGSAAA